MFDSEVVQTFGNFMRELDKRKIAFVELCQASKKHRDIDIKIRGKVQIDDVFTTFNDDFTGIIIGNTDFQPEQGLERIRLNQMDMVSFGVLAISNPDLAIRLQNNLELNFAIDQSTWNQGDEKGYIDFENYNI